MLFFSILLVQEVNGQFIKNNYDSISSQLGNYKSLGKKIHYLDSLKSSHQNAEDLQILHKLKGLEYSFLQEDSALYNFNKQLEYAEVLFDSFEISDAYFNQAYALTRSGIRYKEAYLNYHKSLNISLSQKEWKRAVHCIVKMKDVYESTENYSGYLNLLLNGLERIENLNDTSNVKGYCLGRLYGSLGINYSQSLDSTQQELAEYYLLKAIEKFRFNSVQQTAWSHYQISEHYLRIVQMPLAKKHLDSCLTTLNDWKYPIKFKSDAILLLGKYYYQSELYSKTDSIAHWLIKVDKKECENCDILAKRLLAKSSLAQKKYFVARKIYLELMETPHFSENLKMQKEIYRGLHQIATIDNRVVEALNYLNEYVSLDDKIDSLKQGHQVFNQKVNELVKFQKKENKMLTKKLKIIHTEKKRDTLILGASLCIFLLISTLLFVTLKRRSKTQRKLQGEILEIQTQIKEKNNQISELSLNNEALSKVENLNSQLNSIATDNDWLQFLIKFDLVNKGFFKKLSALNKGAKLTKNEKRLSALMKVELTNKEISLTLNITEDSVKKAKKRLKAKLNLPEEETLSGYIKQI